jgi:peptidoglycan/LPS O-acetylase OafA/YrhL
VAEADISPAGGHRFEPLDWLRGLLALSIMLYHLTTWDVTPLSADSLLGRLGVYGVSMFFVLSGLSIAVAYHHSMGTAGGIRRFAVRRIFRIWPLMWLAVLTLTTILAARGDAPSWRLIALNLTTLFGFVKPTAYLNAGAWSIGNEMVYYALTPLIFAAYNRSVRLGNGALLATIVVAAVFAFHWLRADATLALQWPSYINPFNNLVLYTAGVALFYNATGPAWSNGRVLAAMALATGVLGFYPAIGDQALIVTGVNRVVFCTACVLLVLSFYKSNLPLPRVLAMPLTQLGLATYGVYLLHPLVRELCRLALPTAGAAVTLPSTIAATLLLAWVVYHHFELPMMQLGKRFARPAPAPAHVR